MADYTLSAKVTLDASEFQRNAKNIQGTLGNMTKSVGLGNIAANIFSRGMGALSSSMGQAVKRIDTLKNFPIVMQSLGYDSNDAATAIQKVSDSLDGLPTSTDAIVATMQQLAPSTKSLNEAADVALAFNNALLAGGMPLSQQSAALYQYTKMMSTGTVDARDWRSIQAAMPGQLRQVAKALLGASASGSDLYAAMKSGKISVQDFNSAIVTLNKQGLPGLGSFEEQARAATGGIGTALDNLKNRLARGLANIMDSIGRERISGFINSFSKQAADGLTSLGSVAAKAADVILPFLEGVVEHLPQIAAGLTAIVGAKGVASMVKGIAGGLSNLGARAGVFALKLSDMAASISASGNLSGKFSGKLSELAGGFSKLSPLAGGAAIALAGFAAAIVVNAIAKYTKEIGDFAAATEGIKAAALGATGEIENMNDALDVSSRLSTAGAKSIQELNESGAKIAQDMRDRNSEMTESNAVLDAYMNTIQELNGQFSATETDGEKLRLSVEKLNEALGTDYTVEVDKEGRYRVMAGDAEVATEAIRKLVEMKKAEARVEAYSQNYTDAIKQQAEAAKTMAEIRQKIANSDDAAEIAVLTGQLRTAEKDYNEAGEAAEYASEMMGNASKSADENASSLFRLIEGNQGVSAALVANGNSIEDFEKALKAAGITEKEWASLSDEKAAQVASSFDGSKESIINAMLGVEKLKGSVVTLPNGKKVTINADTDAALSRLKTIKAYVDGLKNGNFKFSVQGIISAVTGNAAGGFFLGAPGILGSIPRHADGGILTSAALTNVGWVGEAGAEAILPLSNRTYIKPLSKSIAADLAGYTGGDVNVYMTYNAGEDGRKLAYDLVRNVEILRAQGAF